MTDPDRVLVPTFGRSQEEETLAYTLETFPTADVTVLAVVTPLDAPLSEGGILDRDDERLEAARERATHLRESVDGATDRIDVATADGRPGTIIPQYATEHDFDHVVLSSHDTRSSDFMRRLLGRNVATTIVDRTPRPVTVLD